MLFKLSKHAFIVHATIYWATQTINCIDYSNHQTNQICSVWSYVFSKILNYTKTCILLTHPHKENRDSCWNLALLKLYFVYFAFSVKISLLRKHVELSQSDLSYAFRGTLESRSSKHSIKQIVVSITRFLVCWPIFGTRLTAKHRSSLKETN